MNSLGNVSLLNVIGSGSVAKNFEREKKRWPWIDSISDDGHNWVISGGAGEKEDAKDLSLNTKLPDGTFLADECNRELYGVVVDYAETFRLFNSDISALVHYQRVRALIAFVCWLNSRKIKTLKKVKIEHIKSYADHVAYGVEIALGVPNKVFDAVRTAIKNDVQIPMSSGYINRRDMHRVAGTDYFFSEVGSGLTYTRSILTWFENKFKKDIFDVSSVEFMDVLDEMDNLPTKVTHQDVHRKLLPLEEIWMWQSHMKTDGFTVNPFPEGASKASMQLGVKCKRTKSIPPKVAFELLGQSVEWVLDYAPVILKLYSENSTPEHAMTTLNKMGLELNIKEAAYFASPTRGTVSMEGVLRMLGAACFAVIASLTARRKEELFDLGSGCIDPRDDGAFWLTAYIEKTSQRYDLAPVPGLVKKAIDVLEKISKEARKRTGDDSIWQYITSNNKVSSLQVKDSLQDFYDFNVKEITGIDWKLSPHQFRRFFALIYFYRYEGAYIGALSYHLRHFNLEMTRRYVADDDFMKEMNDVSEEWSATFLRGVISGNRKIGGKGGDKIKKKFKDWLVHYRGKVDVVERELVVDKMFRYMKRLGVNFYQHVWGTVCSCPKNTSLSSKAKCANENGVPELSNGTEELCGGCPFGIYTERYNQGLKKDIASRTNTKKFSGEDTILNELAGVKIVSLEGLVKRAETITTIDES